MNPQRVYDMGLIMIPLVCLMFVGIGILSSISLELSLIAATIVSVITVGVLMFGFHPVHLCE